MCDETSHFAKNCPRKKQPESTRQGLLAESLKRPDHQKPAGGAVVRHGNVDRRNFGMLFNSRVDITVIGVSPEDSRCCVESGRLRCVHGDTYEYPTAVVDVRVEQADGSLVELPVKVAVSDWIPKKFLVS